MLRKSSILIGPQALNIYCIRPTKAKTTNTNWKITNIDLVLVVFQLVLVVFALEPQFQSCKKFFL